MGEERGQFRKDHRGKPEPRAHLFINLQHFGMYVGQASNILSRVNNYLNPAFLAHSKNAGIPICQALLKYGADGFAFVILEYTPIDLLNIREIFRITLLQPYYNIIPGGFTRI